MTKNSAQNRKFEKVSTFESAGILTRNKRRFVHLGEINTDPRLQYAYIYETLKFVIVPYYRFTNKLACNIVQLRYAVFLVIGAATAVAVALFTHAT